MYLQQLVDKQDALKAQLRERRLSGDAHPIARAFEAMDLVDKRLRSQIGALDPEIIFLRRIRDIAMQYTDADDYKFIADRNPDCDYNVRLMFTNGVYACPFEYSLRTLDDNDLAAHIGRSLGLTMIKYFAMNEGERRT